MLVLDASAAIGIALDELPPHEAESLLREIREDGALVPPLWDQEVGNALLVAERRGRITQAETTQGIELLDSLPIEVHEIDPELISLVNTARQFGLTTYDATYLLIAMQSGFALATRDAALSRAAEEAGVRVV